MANFLKTVALHNVGQLQKINFSIEKSILGWKLTSGKAAFQWNFNI